MNRASARILRLLQNISPSNTYLVAVLNFKIHLRGYIKNHKICQVRQLPLLIEWGKRTSDDEIILERSSLPFFSLCEKTVGMKNLYC